MKDIIVKKSKIEGLGVFANRDFKKDEVVIKYGKSKKINKNEYEALPKEEKSRVSLVNGEYIHFQAPERYVNHSCDANIYSKDFCDVAKRDIKKGEEITSDYDEEGGLNANFKCRCGSKDCRDIVKGK